MKTVKFVWRELVWEEYRCEYTEKEWIDIQNYFKENAERQAGTAAERYAVARYGFVSKFTFDDVCDILNGVQDDPVLTYTVENNGRTWSYDETLTEIIRECMRDDAFDMGPCDSWNADDYDEELYVAFADDEDDDVYDEDEDDYNPFVNDVEIC